MEVGDDEFAEGDSVILTLDRVTALDLSELEPLIEAPDVGMVIVIVREDEAALDIL